MTQYEHLIHELTNQLEPAPKRLSLLFVYLLWVILAFAFVVAIIHLTGDVRENGWQQLWSETAFTIEIASGIAIVMLLAGLAFASSVPSLLSRKIQFVAFGLICLCGCVYVWSFISPSLPPSMEGKRDYCMVESLLYAIPGAAWSIWLLSRRYLLTPYKSLALAGTAAGLIPAIYMQVACMYDPMHGLKYHVIPGLWVVPILLMTYRLKTFIASRKK